MRSLSSIVGLLATATVAVAAPLVTNGSSSNPIVNLGYAQYQGITNESLGITTYYGLQFAAPPTGSQRWRPPVAIENSTVFQGQSPQIVNATTPGYQCVQGYPAWITALSALGGIPPSLQVSNEDCLRLDVIVPSAPVSSSLPVIIQIHGGGYTIGSSTFSDGSAFTSYSNGSVIWVQIQYRLGFYGFLNNEAVRTDGTANAGLLDQRSAIEWVQRNIARFGGDPSKVTIWGGSAGGGSVTAQMQLYGGEANPPFRAAIAEYPWWQPFHTDRVLEAQYSELLQVSNCTDLACLRNLPADTLANATQDAYTLGYAAGNYGYGDFYAGPAVDGTIIKEFPSVAFSSGRYSKVALLTDREGYEGALFTNFTISTESEIQPDLETVWQNNSTTFFTRLFELYPESNFTGPYFDNAFFTTFSNTVNTTTNNSVYWQTQSIFGDFIINCPSYYISSDVTAASQPVWKLVFAAGSELHGATQPFFALPNAATVDPTLAAQLKSYFLGFAVNLDPNSQAGNGSAGAARPNWPTYLAGGQAGEFNVLSINMTSIAVGSDPDANERCDFFHGQSYVVRN